MPSLSDFGLNESNQIKPKELFAENAIFSIVDAKAQNGTFNPQVRFTLEMAGSNARKTLYLTDNQVRSQYVQFFATNRGIRLRAKIGKLDNEKGQPTWVFRDVSEDEFNQAVQKWNDENPKHNADGGEIPF